MCERESATAAAAAAENVVVMVMPAMCSPRWLAVCVTDCSQTSI